MEKGENVGDRSGLTISGGPASRWSDGPRRGSVQKRTASSFARADGFPRWPRVKREVGSQGQPTKMRRCFSH